MGEPLKLSDVFSSFHSAFHQGDILTSCNIPGLISSPMLAETQPKLMVHVFLILLANTKI